MEKGYLCEKRCPFFVPGYRYADKGEGGKNHEKGHCGKMLLLFGAACMLMTGCGTKESSKWIQKI